jgi:hypothetical protein
MIASLIQDSLVRFDDATPETMVVAMLRQEPVELSQRGTIEFDEGYDDLDYLVFSLLYLPSRRRIAFVRHRNSPSPGTEICVVPNELKIAAILVETIRFLNLSEEDILWIHPRYETEFKEKMGTVV